MVPTQCFLRYIKEKDTIKYPAGSYEKDFKNGRDEFYKGETAKQSVIFRKKEQ
jgi:hypothetical protein